MHDGSPHSHSTLAVQVLLAHVAAEHLGLEGSPYLAFDDVAGAPSGALASSCGWVFNERASAYGAARRWVCVALRVEGLCSDVVRTAVVCALGGSRLRHGPSSPRC